MTKIGFLIAVTHKYLSFIFKYQKNKFEIFL